MSPITETLADVAALIPRYSWEIMDEEQRDELMANVVLPRYMQTTADGIELGPTAWAEMVGATAESIRGRVRRLQQSQKEANGERSAVPEWKRRDQRDARRVLREATPEQAREIVESLPSEQKARFVDAAMADPAARIAAAKAASRIESDQVERVHREQKERAPELVHRHSFMEAAHELFRARRAYAKALDLARELDLGDEERDALVEENERIALIHDWFKSYLSSGEGSFDAALAELLEEGR